MDTIASKLEKAAEIKNNGNNYFKNQEYSKAKREYFKVFLYTRGLPGSKRGMEGTAKLANPSGTSANQLITDDEEAIAVDLEAIVHTNLSICFLKLGDADRALEQAANAIKLKPSSWKAFLRKSEALILKGDYEKAEEALNAAESLIDPGDASGLHALKETKKRLVSLNREAARKQKMSLSGFLTK